MNESYVTLSVPGESEVVEKKSRFLGIALPVTSAQHAMEQVSKLKAKYHDARHNCFAYRLKNGDKRYADDGEPQGTAGMPILDILEKKNITDCLIVVTRYFGGTLLGTGGLVRAYSAAAAQAVERAVKVKMEPYIQGSLRVSYTEYNRLPVLLEKFGAMIKNTDFDAQVQVDFVIPPEQTAPFADALTQWSGGTLTATFGNTVFAGREME